jgi:hypothetical protein
MAVKVVDLCSDPYCDKHAGRFVRLATERGIELEELGLASLEAS